MNLIQNILNKLMWHSLSIGADAKTGLGFEKQRTNYRLLNKMAYGLVGVKNYVGLSSSKLFKIKEILKSFNKLEKNIELTEKPIKSTTIENNHTDDNENEEIKILNEDDNNQDPENEQSNLEVTSKIIVASEGSEYGIRYLTGNPVSFFCWNLPSIMGGNLNLYEATKDTLGYSYIGYDSSIYTSSLNSSFNDGKLEFATFESLLDLVMSKGKYSIYFNIFHIGKFITQESGPFVFEFNTDKDFNTYLNVDGEFYMLNNPLSITIKKAESVWKNGKVRVLVNERDKIFDTNIFSLITKV